jgi:hypothetical protein
MLPVDGVRLSMSQPPTRGVVARAAFRSQGPTWLAIDEVAGSPLGAGVCLVDLLHGLAASPALGGGVGVGGLAYPSCLDVVGASVVGWFHAHLPGVSCSGLISSPSLTLNFYPH